MRRSGDGNFEISQTAQTVDDRGFVFCHHAGIQVQDEIAFE
jgi:hypothetical protein